MLLTQNAQALAISVGKSKHLGTLHTRVDLKPLALNNSYVEGVIRKGVQNRQTTKLLMWRCSVFVFALHPFL